MNKMKVTVPPSRIRLLENSECELELFGGATQKKLFLSINNGEDKSYHATRPSLAALKAYYAHVRATKPQSTPIHDSNTVLEGIESETRKVAGPEQVAAYMELVRHARAEPPKRIYLRRPHDNRVLTYDVGYQRVRKPNKHEVEKGIVKVAVAVKAR
jgi:hypothetical protein